jgi:hypothetical protein
LKYLVRAKIDEKSRDFTDFGRNSEFARIIISKFTREQTESIMEVGKFREMVD